MVWRYCGVQFFYFCAAFTVHRVGGKNGVRVDL